MALQPGSIEYLIAENIFFYDHVFELADPPRANARPGDWVDQMIDISIYYAHSISEVLADKPCRKAKVCDYLAELAVQISCRTQPPPESGAADATFEIMMAILGADPTFLPWTLDFDGEDGFGRFQHSLIGLTRERWVKAVSKILQKALN